MAFGVGRLPPYDGVYSRAQKTWLNSIARVDGGEAGEARGEEDERRKERRRGKRQREEEEAGGRRRRKKRNKSKKQGGRRRQQSLVSRLIPLPPSHLIALSHATSGCVGVSGRLKKPSAPVDPEEDGRSGIERREERKRRGERRGKEME